MRKDYYNFKFEISLGKKQRKKYEMIWYAKWRSEEQLDFVFIYIKISVNWLRPNWGTSLKSFILGHLLIKTLTLIKEKSSVQEAHLTLHRGGDGYSPKGGRSSSASSGITVLALSLHVLLHEGYNCAHTDAKDKDQDGNGKTSCWASSQSLLHLKLHPNIGWALTWCRRVNRCAFSGFSNQVNASKSLSGFSGSIDPLLDSDFTITDINKEWGVGCLTFRSISVSGTPVEVAEQLEWVDLLGHWHWIRTALVTVDLSWSDNIVRSERHSWSWIVLPQIKNCSPSSE